jgi:hypothetical protein
MIKRGARWLSATASPPGAEAASQPHGIRRYFPGVEPVVARDVEKTSNGCNQGLPSFSCAVRFGLSVASAIASATDCLGPNEFRTVNVTLPNVDRQVERLADRRVLEMGTGVRDGVELSADVYSPQSFGRDDIPAIVDVTPYGRYDVAALVPVPRELGDPRLVLNWVRWKLCEQRHGFFPGA